MLSVIFRDQTLLKDMLDFIQSVKNVQSINLWMTTS